MDNMKKHIFYRNIQGFKLGEWLNALSEWILYLLLILFFYVLAFSGGKF